MTRARRVVISQEVDEYITGYKHFLKHPSAPYDKCDARAIRRKVSAMRRGIKQGARYPLTLPDCTDKILGYEVNQDGTPKYPCFKQIIYEDQTSHAQWKCSVIYDASTRTSTVYRMWNCEGIYESCTKWLLLSKFVNRNTMRNNTMKMKRIRFNESTYDMAELRKYLDDFADATIEASKKDFDDPKCNQSIESTRTNVIDYIMGLGLSYDRVAREELDDVYYAAFNFACRPTDNFRDDLEDSKILFLHLIEHSLRNEEN